METISRLLHITISRLETTFIKKEEFILPKTLIPGMQRLTKLYHMV